MAMYKYKWDLLSDEEKHNAKKRIKGADLKEMSAALGIVLDTEPTAFNFLLTEDVLIAYYQKMTKEDAKERDDITSYAIFTKNPDLLTEQVRSAMKDKGLLDDRHWLVAALAADNGGL